MKLKYHFLSGLILACGLGLSSCNDSFLERNPKDQLSDVSFWKTADDANKYATGIYLYLIEPENHTIMTDCYTDNAIPVHVGAEQGVLSAGTAVSSNPHFLQLWQAAYETIRRCQIFYEHIGEVSMNEKAKAQLTAEVQFLEAFAYHNLWKYMGGVPILDHPLQLNEPLPARSSAEETYEYVVKLLDKAAPNLPEIRTAADHGKASAGACYALKALRPHHRHHPIGESLSGETRMEQAHHPHPILRLQSSHHRRRYDGRLAGDGCLYPRRLRAQKGRSHRPADPACHHRPDYADSEQNAA